MLNRLIKPWLLPTQPLTGKKLRFAQVLAVFVSTSSILMFITALPARYDWLERLAGYAHPTLFHITNLQPWLIDLIMPLYPRAALGIEIGVMLLYILSSLLLYKMRSHDWMALLTAAGMAAFALHITPTLFTWMGLSAANTLIGSAFKIVGLGCAFMFLYLFPGGFYSPSWMRLFFLGWLVWAVLWLLYPRSVFAFRDPYTISIPGFIIFMSWWGVGVFSQIYRYYKVSGPIERQQTKFITFGATLVVISYFIYVPLREYLLYSERTLAGSLLFQLFAPYVYLLAVGAMPIVITLSIIRYRIWDIDIIIRRTLVYTALTGVLILLYFASVVIMQAAVTPFVGGEQTALVTVGSTLLIASLFHPMRKRLQTQVDRSFYRQRYNTEQALAEFAEAARSADELDRLVNKLSHVIIETLHPESIDMWLCSQSKKINDYKE
jgi:hypothetical protein